MVPPMARLFARAIVTVAGEVVRGDGTRTPITGTTELGRVRTAIARLRLWLQRKGKQK